MNDDFIKRIEEIIDDLKNNKNFNLISLFKEYCFNENPVDKENLEYVLTKVMYTFYEDFYYSKRYFKGKEYSNVFNQEYLKLWENIYSFLCNGETNEVLLLRYFRSFINILRLMAYREDIQISEKYSIPKGNFEITTFLQGLLLVTHDFDEWRIFSNGPSFQIILKKLINIIINKIEEKYQNEEINFFCLRMSALPIGFCLRQQLRNNFGYKKIKIYIIDDKIYSPIDYALRNTNPTSFSNAPIFIFDSVIKTGFNKYYISEIIKKLFIKFKLPKELPIYYVVIVNFKQYHSTEDHIRNAFEDFNFKIISIYEADEQRFGEQELESIHEDRLFWANLNTWFFKEIFLPKNELEELQKCKQCNKLLDKINPNYFQNCEERELFFFKDIKFTSEYLKSCRNCEHLYLLETDNSKIEKIRKDLLNIRIS